MEKLTADRRKALLIEYEELSRQRNGINPRLSTYAKLTAQMDAIKRRLADYEDPEGYVSAVRKKRNKAKRKSVLRRIARDIRNPVVQ